MCVCVCVCVRAERIHKHTYIRITCIHTYTRSTHTSFRIHMAHPHALPNPHGTPTRTPTHQRTLIHTTRAELKKENKKKWIPPVEPRAGPAQRWGAHPPSQPWFHCPPPPPSPSVATRDVSGKNGEQRPFLFCLRGGLFGALSRARAHPRARAPHARCQPRARRPCSCVCVQR